jgi:hypothetical protein
MNFDKNPWDGGRMCPAAWFYAKEEKQGFNGDEIGSIIIPYLDKADGKTGNYIRPNG